MLSKRYEGKFGALRKTANFCRPGGDPSCLIMQTTEDAKVFSAVMTNLKLGRTLLHDLQTETKYPWNFFEVNHSSAFVGKV